MRTEQATRLTFKSQFSKTSHDESFRPDERHASAEALICLNCTLPENKCKPLSCQRYKDERMKIKGERQ